MAGTIDDPQAELERMAAVRRYDVLDTPRDGTFDRITRIASAVFDVPIAIISIVDEDRIWFKSAVGVDGVEQLDREPGLCASAILQDDIWLIEDARVDPRALANPLVAGEFGLQFYAGAPLRTSDGARLGTMCIIDREPRELSARDQQLLEDLAAVVIDELELRVAARRAATAIEDRRRQAADLNDDVVQALVVTKLSIELGRQSEATDQLDKAITSAKRILADLAGDAIDLRRMTRDDA